MQADSSLTSPLSAEVLKVYETLPDPYLILTPDLIILAVTDAYLAATLTVRAEMVGRFLLDAFAENPIESSVSSRNLLLASLQRVLRTGRPDPLPVQRYDVRRPGAADQGFEEKYWSVLNSPVLAPDGTVRYLINKISDVTELVKQGHTIEGLSREVDATKAVVRDNGLLVQQLQKANALLDAIGEAYVELSPEGVFTYVNRCAEQLLNVDKTTLLGQNLWTSSAPSISREGQQIIRQAISTGQRAEGEYVCRNIGRWVYISATPAPDGIIVLFYDIQEVKEAREKLEQEHQRLKDSQAIGHIGSFEVALARGHVSWSDELYHIHGLAPQSEEPTVARCLSFMFPEDQQTFMQQLTMSQLLPRFGLVHRIRRRDGTVRIVETRAEVQRDAQGHVTRVYGTVQDVTETRQAEKEARDSASQFQALVENTPDSITRWDQRLRLVFANSAYCQRLAQPLAELLGKTTREMHHPEAVAGPWMDKLRLVLDTGQAHDHYNSTPTATGTKYFYSRLVPEAAEDGAVLSVLAIAREITDIKRLEKEHLQLQLSQQQQLLNAVLEAQEVERRRIAESLHNGLGQVLFATKLHLEQIQIAPTMANGKDMLAAKERAGSFLSEAIKATRTISHELIPTTLDDFGLAAAIRDVCLHMSHGALRIQCQVTGLAPKLDKYLELAVFRLVQELVNNIVKHAQATQARVVVAHEAAAICLTAQDNGRGFDAHQVSQPGIGLKTIRDRVKLLGGTTEILSAAGQGTTVTIWFPVVPE